MRRLFVAVGACGLLAVGMAGASGDPATPAPPAPPTPPGQSPSPSEIQARVEKLGSDQFTEREAATAALEKIGLPAANALKAAAKSDVPEVRERAAILLGKMHRAADSTSRLVPKRVTLNYVDIPLGTALNDLKTRTGLNITLDPNRIDNPLRR